MTIHIPLWLLLALIPVALLLLFEQIWVHYLAVMHLKQVMGARGLKPVSRFFALWVVLPIGVFLDWIGNLLCTFLCLDPPGGWATWNRPLHSWADFKVAVIEVLKELITGRLQRYEDGPDGRRRRYSWAFAEDMLNPFDQPEGHIKRKEAPHG